MLSEPNGGRIYQAFICTRIVNCKGHSVLERREMHNASSYTDSLLVHFREMLMLMSNILREEDLYKYIIFSPRYDIYKLSALLLVSHVFISS